MSRLRTIKNANDLIKNHPLIFKQNILSKNKKINFYLEIGSGKGQFITRQAINNHSNVYIGVDRSPTIIYKAIKKIERQNIEFPNLYFINCDAKRIFDIFRHKIFTKIFINFCDPWPKKRHEKRRLTSLFFLRLYKKILKKNGTIEFKTDNDLLYSFTLQVLMKNKFKIIYSTSDLYKNLNNKFNRNNVTTEYEDKFLKQNKNINKIIWHY